MLVTGLWCLKMHWACPSQLGWCHYLPQSASEAVLTSASTFDTLNGDILSLVLSRMSTFMGIQAYFPAVSNLGWSSMVFLGPLVVSGCITPPKLLFGDGEGGLLSSHPLDRFTQLQGKGSAIRRIYLGSGGAFHTELGPNVLEEHKWMVISSNRAWRRRWRLVRGVRVGQWSQTGFSQLHSSWIFRLGSFQHPDKDKKIDCIKKSVELR